MRVLKAEVIETLLYGCATWSPIKVVYDGLRKFHHQMLLRCLGWQNLNHEDDILSYSNALVRTDFTIVEMTVRRPRMLLASFAVRMGEERLPRWVRFGEVLGSEGYSGRQEWD